ncbi:MAG: hypothetical protein ACR2FM_03450 [Candidatus Saccharimonadales bacterium]
MEMLRSFEYRPNFDIVLETLKRFDVELPEHIAIVRFEVITPDSFTWRLLIGNSVYYLYAEDYVPGLGHVESIFDQYIENANWSFVKPKITLKFEDATPVQGATTYQEPDNSDEMMQYAVDSGHDLVFLARSIEDAEYAQFSDSAPRGFTPGS